MSVVRVSAVVAALALALSVAPLGCGTTRRAGSPAAAAPARALPNYDEIRSAYNRRTDRLGRVWGRAVVTIGFVDSRGKRRSEQGEGHFQLIQPSRLALSIGKLGEVLVWIGCDEDRYWLIDPKESKRAYVGRHDLVTAEKVERMGLPAAPLDLIRLTGATPLPASNPGVVFGWGKSAGGGERLIVESPEGERVWRYTIDPDLSLPERIELLRKADRTILLTATLENFEAVQLRGVGGFHPLMAARLTAEAPESGSQMRASLWGMNDGGSTRLSAENFDFEALLGILGVTPVIDLDATAISSAVGSR